MPDKIALITGGTDGIGKATARKLLSVGWKVVIIGRDAQRCAVAVGELGRAARGGEIAAIACDLSLMEQTRRAIDTFLAQHDGLDVLFLNANSISQARTITSERFESNFALGHLSRALMVWKLEDALRARPGSQVLTSVGLNVSRLDFDDLTMKRRYSSLEALGRWQWAAQVFAREFSRRSSTAMNIYVPGLVRTKMLESLGWPIGTAAKAMSLVVGLPVDKAAANVVTVLNDVPCSGNRGLTYVWRKPRNLFDLKLQPGDPERLWDLTAELLRPYQ